MEPPFYCLVSCSARTDSDELRIMRLRPTLLYAIPMTLVVAGLISRRAIPEIWLVECLFAGYRIYLTAIGASLLMVFGELYLVEGRARQRPSLQRGAALRSWTPGTLYGKRWWVVWGLLVLGFILLSFLDTFVGW